MFVGLQDLLVVLSTVDLLEHPRQLLPEGQSLRNPLHLRVEGCLFLQVGAVLFALLTVELAYQVGLLSDVLHCLVYLLHEDHALDLVGIDLNQSLVLLSQEVLNQFLYPVQSFLGFNYPILLHQEHSLEHQRIYH